ncbi:hypothetical protein Tsubulata_034012 [Turnera subulata]|uniref:Uncharacterized protein n=1 Tax=Turnera subulata TaxID=218843 RepID=A0A9Q0FY09_9ROSI|nr:hypothetical protein Tsubulata_034012 [Turnera subulata]
MKPTSSNKTLSTKGSREERFPIKQESARTSRIRKQKHLDKLGAQNVMIAFFRMYVSKKKLLIFPNAYGDLQISSPYTATTALRDLEEEPCITAHLRAESSNKPISSSIDLLH